MRTAPPALLQVVLLLFSEKSLDFFYEKSFDSTVKRASTFLQEVFRQFYEKNLHEIIDFSRLCCEKIFHSSIKRDSTLL